MREFLNKTAIYEQIKAKQSFLCVGLDSDIERLPAHLKGAKDAQFQFNKEIIEATKDLCVAYKLNTAFYESNGLQGWSDFERTLEIIPDDIFVIADAKRGDIGNTARNYARAFYRGKNIHSVTINPYMGKDNISPFLEYSDETMPEQHNRWAILLGLTSNAGSKDFQFLEVGNKPLYQQVIETSKTWGTSDNLMYVIGATHPEKFQEIRKFIPDHFLLVPGVGAQGGDLQAICQYGMNEHCGLLVNSSRGIIFAGEGEDFAEKARSSALKLQQQMAELL